MSCPPWHSARNRSQLAKLCTYCAPRGAAGLDVNADPSRDFNLNSLEGLATESNDNFHSEYVNVGETNAAFNFGPTGPSTRSHKYVDRIFLWLTIRAQLHLGAPREGSAVRHTKQIGWFDEVR
jgi:hypothetical protein